MTYRGALRLSMSSASLRPDGVEIRFMGTSTEEEFATLRALIEERRQSERIRAAWSVPSPLGDLYPHHAELGGFKLVTPVEVGTIVFPMGGGDATVPSFSLQMYRSLTPCYQAWHRLTTPADSQEPGANIRWTEIRDRYRALIRQVDGLGLEPRIVVWTIRPSDSPVSFEIASGAGQLLSPRFFDKVLGQEGSDYRAASWFGTSFVGLSISEGREHYLVVDGDSTRPFRVSQLFYLLVGRAKAHDLAEEMHRRVAEFERDPKLRIEERPTLPVNPPIAELQKEVDRLSQRRIDLASWTTRLSEDFSHVDMLKDFVRYHTVDLVDAKNEREVTTVQCVPRVGWETQNYFRLRYEGPVDETVQWARASLRRARERVDDVEQVLRDRMDLMLSRRLWNYQWIVLALSVVVLVTSILAVLHL